MVPGRDGGTVDGTAAPWANDDVPASEWLTDPKLQTDDPGPGTDAAAREAREEGGQLLQDVDRPAGRGLRGAHRGQGRWRRPRCCRCTLRCGCRRGRRMRCRLRAGGGGRCSRCRLGRAGRRRRRRRGRLGPAGELLDRTNDGRCSADYRRDDRGERGQELGLVDARGDARRPRGVGQPLGRLATRPEAREWLISSEREHSRQREHSAEQPSLGRESRGGRTAPRSSPACYARLISNTSTRSRCSSDVQRTRGIPDLLDLPVAAAAGGSRRSP